MELGFAWHHAKTPKYARADFEDMIDLNCNAVLIAASENDLDYWYPNMVEIIEEAKSVGLKVWLNYWAFGGVFGGEPPSVFLHNNHNYRQKTAESQEFVPAACINAPEFRQHFHSVIDRTLSDMKIDGVFFDEPHYYLAFDISEFTCTCDYCKSKFKNDYNTEMPLVYNDVIDEFRKSSMLQFLTECCSKVKNINSSIETCVCVIPKAFETLGTPNWESILAIPEIDMFSTDPYYHIFGMDREWAIKTAARTFDLAKKYGKKSQLWVQLFRIPNGEEESVSTLIPVYRDLGVDSIFGWSYLANKGTSISSDNPDVLWKLVTDEYRRIT